MSDSDHKYPFDQTSSQPSQRRNDEPMMQSDIQSAPASQDDDNGAAPARTWQEQVANIQRNLAAKAMSCDRDTHRNNNPHLGRGETVKRIPVIIALFLAVPLTAQQPSNQPVGKWLDTSKDNGAIVYFSNSQSTHMIVSEDFEVVQTHEICASVYGYFMEKSQQGRYDVNFKGMRTSATFTFTTQHDAEHWVTKWCTPQSLLQIKAGKGVFARNY